MTYRRTKYSFHDAQLEAYSVGPRNEVTLDIALDQVWNPDAPSIYTIRFGAIRNMTEVEEFFCHLPQEAEDGGYLAEIIGIVYEHKHKWVLDLDGIGSIVIESPKFTEPKILGTQPRHATDG